MKTLTDYASLGQLVKLGDGAVVFSPSDACSAFLIVTQGTVRVEQTNSAGRTVVLYRVQAGGSCVLTTTCLIAGRPYSGYGYAEGDVQARAIPAPQFQNLMQTEPAFQALVFQSFADRIGEITDVIDDLLEHRTDLRLARWLANAAQETLHKTQNEIAQELGTAREVVSRTLKTFEANGWVSQSRGRISIKNRTALTSYSHPREK